MLTLNIINFEPARQRSYWQK